MNKQDESTVNDDDDEEELSAEESEQIVEEIALYQYVHKLTPEERLYYHAFTRTALVDRLVQYWLKPPWAKNVPYNYAASIRGIDPALVRAGRMKLSRVWLIVSLTEIERTWPPEGHPHYSSSSGPGGNSNASARSSTDVKSEKD